MACRYRNLILALATMQFFGSASYAQRVTYTVGVEELKYYPQYSYEGKEYQGYAKELLDAFANWANIEFKYDILPVKRLFRTYLDSQTLDFKYPDNPYWNAQKKQDLTIYYSDSITEYIDGVVVPIHKKGQDISAFKKLGTIRDYTTFEYLGLIKEGKVRLYETDSLIGLLEMVLSNRIDGAYINIAVAKYNLKAHLQKPHALIFDESLPHTKSSYYLSSIKHPQIIEKMNIFLKDEQQLVDHLRKKYSIQVYWDKPTANRLIYNPSSLAAPPN
jgi:polar amino acid transport system substrate-binding protein